MACKRMTDFASDVSFLMFGLFYFSSKIPFWPPIKMVLMVLFWCLTQTDHTNHGSPTPIFHADDEDRPHRRALPAWIYYIKPPCLFGRKASIAMVEFTATS